MSQFSNQIIKTFEARASITAYTCVAALATTTASVGPWNTVTLFPIGVAQNNASTGDAIEVCIGGTSKVGCQAAVTGGQVVQPGTVTANITLGIGCIKNAATFTVTTNWPTLGIALESGLTNSVIEVLVNPTNVYPA